MTIEHTYSFFIAPCRGTGAAYVPDGNGWVAVIEIDGKKYKSNPTLKPSLALYRAGRVAYEHLPRWLQAAIVATEVAEESINAKAAEHFCGHTHTARWE